MFVNFSSFSLLYVHAANATAVPWEGGTEKKKMEMDLLESYRKVHEARTATILGLAKLAEYRDEGTGTHLERIREYARILTVQLAKNPKFSGVIDQQYIDDIYQSSILHDIGKV